MNKSFVLIHLGEVFFEYINDCITQIFKFNDEKIFLIIDRKHQDKIHNKKVELIFVDEIKKTNNHIFFDKTNKLNTSFRNGFWKFTTERFLYLEDVITQYNLENVIHLENDTLIYFNYNEYINIFEKYYSIATVFDNDNRSIPCIVYLKNADAIFKLNSFICTITDKNDMELVSEYRNHIDNRITLPILPINFSIELKSKLGHTTKNKEQYFNNFEKFNSIFDGASIGQFIGGIDPKNKIGNTIGFENESCLFNPKNLNVFFKKDEINRKIPYINYNGNSFKINNLHIHSKNLKKYLS